MLIELGGEVIGNILLENLAPTFPRIYISVRSKDQALALVDGGIHLPAGASFVEDLVSFPGGARDDAAIFGLYSVLLAVQEAFVLVISADMPFVSPDTAKLLSDCLESDPDAVIPLWENGFMEPAFAIYKVQAAIPVIEVMLASKQYQLVKLASGLKKVTRVPVEAFKQVDPSLTCFINVNSERELDQARQLHAKRSGKKMK